MAAEKKVALEKNKARIVHEIEQEIVVVTTSSAAISQKPGTTPKWTQPLLC